MKLVKLSSDHYVIVDENRDIHENDYTLKNGQVEQVSFLMQDNGHVITHSTQPITNEVGNDGFEFDSGSTYPPTNVQPLFLSDVKELLGEVDVQQKSFAFIKEIGGTREQRLAYIDGYRDALEDNKDRKYTEQDMRTVFMHGFLLGVDRGDYSRDMEDRAMSYYTQPKISWEVEMVDGKLKLKS